MIYRNTINIERIELSPLDNINSVQFVNLVKFGDTATFAVSMQDGDGGWYWEFDMSEPSNYERAKMNIYDAIFECDTMSELGEALNAIFEDGFSEILLYDDDDEEDEYEEEEWEDNEDDEDNEDVDNDNSPYCGCPNCRKYRH